MIITQQIFLVLKKHFPGNTYKLIFCNRFLHFILGTRIHTHHNKNNNNKKKNNEPNLNNCSNGTITSTHDNGYAL